jgi:hypothetical protein
MTCESCAGGEVHRHAYNPNRAIDDITVDEDGTVLFVKPLKPSEMCIHELRNVVIELEAGYEQPDNVTPMVWNPDTCRLEPGCWPSSSIIEWDSTQTLEPPTEDDDGNVYCEISCDQGTTFAFRDAQTDCLTHICFGGEMVCLPEGSEAEEPGTPVDQVCYDVSSWSFPASYGGGPGDWFIFGNDYNNAGCTSGTNQFPFQSKEFSCWDDFGGDDGPDSGWNSLTWESPDPYQSSPMIAEAVENISHGCARPAFRMDPNFPVGTTGPITWSFNFTLTSGATRFAAYDKISGNQIPVTIVSAPTQPSGSSMVVENGPNGPQVYTFAAATGNYVLQFSPQSGVQLENICFLIWNLAGVGEPERVDTVSVTASPSTTTCCLQWSSISDLINWMNGTDPIAQGWSLVDGKICQTVASGVGVNYGELSSCDDSSNPTVTQTTSTGGGGGTTTVLPCQTTAPNGRTGDRSGIYIDDCSCIDASPWDPNGTETLAQWLTATYPPSGFLEYWRAPVCGPDGVTNWIMSGTSWGQTDCCEDVVVEPDLFRACELLPDSAFEYSVRADNPLSWNDSRPTGSQLLAVDRFNANVGCGNHVNIFGDPNLCWTGNQIDGPLVMDNGETRVLWPDVYNGVPVIGGQYQFRNDANYMPPPADFGHGSIDPTRAHRLFFDGNRWGYSYIADEIRTGPGADQWEHVFTFVVAPWMFASDPTTFGLDMHAPLGEAGTGAVVGSISNGQFGFFSQYSPTAITPGINANSQTTNIPLGSFNLPPVGTWVTVASDGIIDPTGGGYFNATYSTDGGECAQFVNHGTDYGFYYSDSALTGQFYSIVQQYDFHQFPTATSPNWDDTFGNVRRTFWGGWGLTLNNGTTDLDRVCEHGRALMQSELCEV